MSEPLSQSTMPAASRCYRGFPYELLETAAAAAAEFGLPLVGHLPNGAPWDEESVSDIQHICDPRCARLRTSAIETLAREASAQRVRHTPTLVAFTGLDQADAYSASLGLQQMPRIWTAVFWGAAALRAIGFSELENRRAHTAMRGRVLGAARRLVEVGASIQTGSDTPHPYVVPGESLHQEMRLLAGAALSIPEVWRAATEVPGNLASGDGLGQLRPGAPADILLFRKNPAKDLNAMDSLEIVIANGCVYPAQELQSRLRDQIEYVEGPLYRFGIEPLLRSVIWAAEKRPARLGNTESR